MSGTDATGAAGALRVRAVEEGDYDRGARRSEDGAANDTRRLACRADSFTRRPAPRAQAC
jgi:hypothetical protein